MPRFRRWLRSLFRSLLISGVAFAMVAALVAVDRAFDVFHFFTAYGQVEEETTNPDLVGASEGGVDVNDPAIASGVILASENYHLREITFGGTANVLVSNVEFQPLEIFDVRSESLTSKNQEEAKILVTWKTNKPARSDLAFGRTGAQTTRNITESAYGLTHSAVLSDLESATAYVFTITGRDRWGNEVTSDSYGAYTGAKNVSVFELLAGAFEDLFRWAL